MVVPSARAHQEIRSGRTQSMKCDQILLLLRGIFRLVASNNGNQRPISDLKNDMAIMLADYSNAAMAVSGPLDYAL